MSREIKFRAWDLEKKEMHFVGTLGIYDNVAWAHGLDAIHNTQLWFSEDGFIEKPILMQYTGLKDKNGKEIYEGDIIINAGYQNYYKQIIEWNDANCEFRGKNIHKMIRVDIEPDKFEIESVIEGESWFKASSFSGAEIIGNIYENPELLNIESEGTK